MRQQNLVFALIANGLNVGFSLGHLPQREPSSKNQNSVRQRRTPRESEKTRVEFLPDNGTRLRTNGRFHPDPFP